MTPAELLQRHPRLGLDANVFIYLLEGADRRAKLAGQVIDACESGHGQAVLASIGLAEVLAGPATRGEVALVERIADELRSLAGLRIVGLSADLAVDAAVLRGSGSVTLADAIHLATARAADATAFVTNDRRLSGGPHLAVVYLDDLELAA